MFSLKQGCVPHTHRSAHYLDLLGPDPGIKNALKFERKHIYILTFDIFSHEKKKKDNIQCSQYKNYLKYPKKVTVKSTQRSGSVQIKNAGSR